MEWLKDSSEVWELSLCCWETPYAEPHVRCCERSGAVTPSYSITSLISHAGEKTHYMVTVLMSIILKNFFSSTVPSMALKLVDCYIRNYMSDSVFFSDNKKLLEVNPVISQSRSLI